MSPDLKTAALTTNIHPRVKVAGWLKPEKPSSGLNTPETINMAMMSIEVVSIVKESLTKRNIPITMIPRVMYNSMYSL